MKVTKTSMLNFRVKRIRWSSFSCWTLPSGAENHLFPSSFGCKRAWLLILDSVCWLLGSKKHWSSVGPLYLFGPSPQQHPMGLASLFQLLRARSFLWFELTAAWEILNLNITSGIAASLDCISHMFIQQSITSSVIAFLLLVTAVSLSTWWSLEFHRYWTLIIFFFFPFH